MYVDPASRLHYFEIGVNMVAHDVTSILEVMHSAVLIQGTNLKQVIDVKFYMKLVNEAKCVHFYVLISNMPRHVMVFLCLDSLYYIYSTNLFGCSVLFCSVVLIL